jgi:hypothetical protein
VLNISDSSTISPGQQTQYPLHWRLGRPHIWYSLCRKRYNCSCWGSKPNTLEVQPVAQCYTDRDTVAHGRLTTHTTLTKILQGKSRRGRIWSRENNIKGGDRKSDVKLGIRPVSGSRLWRSVLRHILTEVSEQITASIFRVQTSCSILNTCIGLHTTVIETLVTSTRHSSEINSQLTRRKCGQTVSQRGYTQSSTSA